jgi:uncharacterized protein (TIGR02147 family)
MPSIYSYLNYRDFLKDVFVEQKQIEKPLTHRVVLEKMGISSTGFLSNVIAGKKNLSAGQSDKLSRILRFASRERRYFSIMVTYTQARTLEEKKDNLDRLMAMRKTSLSQMHESQFDIFSHWYYVFIRDMLCFVEFSDNYDALAQMLDPPIKPAEAKQAIADLLALGLIAPDAKGFYRSKDRLITTGDEVHSVQLAHFQLATMDMAKRALEKHVASQRDISFVSLTLSPDSFAKVKSAIVAMRKKLLLIASEESCPDRVCQCNIQLFPVTKALGGDHDKK